MQEFVKSDVVAEKSEREEEGEQGTGEALPSYFQPA